MTPTGKLTTVEYWDAVYASGSADAQSASLAASPNAGRSRKALSGLRKHLRPHVRPYDQAVLWERLYPVYLSNAAGLKAVEIGSAPGTFLVELAQRFGVEPYGIEYTPHGAALNRRLFEQNGISADNVLHDDFFSEQLHTRHRERFDVVISRGFIEHFDDPRSVIDRHVNLLKPGGTLIVHIPNFRGINYAIQRLLDRQILDVHNLTIMDLHAFRALFDAAQLEERFCGYHGAFTFNVFTVGASPRRFPFLRACYLAQIPINALLHLSLRGRTGSSRWVSPFLMYVGVKRA